MKKSLRIGLFLACVLSVSLGHTSLLGPWLRYQSSELGFEIPIAPGWRMTPVTNGMVFAMQSQPDPYVRVAVGRLDATDEALDGIIHQDIRRASGSVRQSICRVDGKDAVMLEGLGPHGPFRDLFIRQGAHFYWVGFAADRTDLWVQYCKTFDIVLEGFRFL